jgi:hypothetical protein
VNPYRWSTTCHVCGEDGVGTFQTAAAAWDSRSRIAHRNPEVCRDVLERKRRELESRIAIPRKDPNDA